MKKINGFEEYTALIDEAKKLHGRLDCNAVLMPKEVQSLIQLGKLYYEGRAHGVTFFCAEKDFFKGYLYSAASAPLVFGSYGKPLVVEFVYTEKRAGEYCGLEQKLQAAGFRFYVKNIRMRCRIPDAYQNRQGTQRLKQLGIDWRPAGDGEREAVYRMWDSLDRYDSIIPGKAEFAQMIENEELIGVWMGAELCGVFRLREENKRTVSMWLVVVREDLRGQGLGKKLHEAAFCAAADRGGYEYIWQWSDIQNKAILNTVGKMGFIPDGIQSKEYILK